MKKLILLTAMVAGLFIAQPSELKAQGIQTNVMMVDGDTAQINSTPEYSTYTLPNGWDVVTIQAFATKLSGTVDGGVYLQGSTNDTTYANIATDSLDLTNVATEQTYIWTITPSKYKYYRVKYQGRGTMHIRYKSKILYQKNEG